MRRIARVVGCVLVLLACTLVAYEAGRMATFVPAFDLARAELQAEMREACPCWFEDSRCKKPGAVVVCRMPDWMFQE